MLDRSENKFSKGLKTLVQGELSDVFSFYFTAKA